MTATTIPAAAMLSALPPRCTSRTVFIRKDENSPEEIDAVLEELQENTEQSEGQWIVLDLAQMPMFTESLYAALTNARCGISLQFSLSNILQHNPHAANPFINEAIQWQKLCDLLLLDDDPIRETVIVLKNTDQASPKTLQEVRRTIRFHESHAINRRFVMTGR